MKRFYNMKIGTKLIISFIIVSIIAGVVGVIGIINIRSINDNGTVLYEKVTIPLSEAAHISTLFQSI